MAIVKKVINKISKWFNQCGYIYYFKKEFSEELKVESDKDFFFTLHEGIKNRLPKRKEELKIKKIKLKFKVNEYDGTDTTSINTMLITILISFVTFSTSYLFNQTNLIKSINMNNKIQDIALGCFYICMCILLIFVFFRLIVKIFGGLKKTFLLLCIDIIEEIEKEIDCEEAKKKKEENYKQIEQMIHKNLTVRGFLKKLFRD